MRRINFFICLILLSNYAIQAQIYTPSGTIQGSSGNNNVGIGLSNPSNKLHIEESVAYNWLARFNNTNASGDGLIVMTNNTVATEAIIAGYSAGNYRFWVGNNGNVGIGIINPLTPLHISSIGTYKFRITHTGVSSWSIKSTSDGTSWWMGTEHDRNLYIGRNETNDIKIEAATGRISIGDVATISNVKLQVQGRVFANTYPDNAFVLNSAGSNYGFILNHYADKWALGYGTSIGSLGTPVLTWTAAGYIGIGTTNPGYKLEINGLSAIKTAGDAGLQIYSTDSNAPYVVLGKNSGRWAIATERDNPGWGGHSSNDLLFYNYGMDNNPMVIQYTTGNVGIGIINPGTYKLNVCGTIRANEVVVNTTGADFVFGHDYELPELAEVEQYIKENKRLPGFESSVEMQENGMYLSEVQTKLIQKIEELTLYIIEQNKRLEQQNSKIISLEQKIVEIESTFSDY